MAETDVERLARVEERVETARREVESLRATRGDHADRLARVDTRMDVLTGRIEEVEGMSRDTAQVVTGSNLPELRQTLRDHGKQLAELDGARVKTDTGFTWALKVAGAIIGCAMAVAQAVTIYMLLPHKP